MFRYFQKQIRTMPPFYAVLMFALFTVGQGLGSTDFEIIANFPFHSNNYLFSTTSLSSFRDCMCHEKTSSCILNMEYSNPTTWRVINISTISTEQYDSIFMNHYSCRNPYRIICDRIQRDYDEDGESTPLFYISDRSCHLTCVGISWNVGISQTSTIYRDIAYLFQDTSAPDSCVSDLSTTTAFPREFSTVMKTSTEKFSSSSEAMNLTASWNTTYNHQKSSDIIDKISDADTNKTPIIVGSTLGIAALLAAAMVIGYLAKRRKCWMDTPQRIHSKNSGASATSCTTTESNVHNGPQATKIDQDKMGISNQVHYDYEIINECKNSQLNDVLKNSGHESQNAHVSSSKLDKTAPNNVNKGLVQANSAQSQMLENAMGNDSLQDHENSHIYDITVYKSDCVVPQLEEKHTYSNVHDQEYFILDENYLNGIEETHSLNNDASHHLNNDNTPGEHSVIPTTTRTYNTYSKLGERKRDFKKIYNTKSERLSETVANTCLHEGNPDITDHIDNVSTLYSLAASPSNLQSSNNHKSEPIDMEYDKITIEYNLANE